MQFNNLYEALKAKALETLEEKNINVDELKTQALDIIEDFKTKAKQAIDKIKS